MNGLFFKMMRVIEKDSMMVGESLTGCRYRSVRGDVTYCYLPEFAEKISSRFPDCEAVASWSDDDQHIEVGIKQGQKVWLFTFDLRGLQRGQKAVFDIHVLDVNIQTMELVELPNQEILPVRDILTFIKTYIENLKQYRLYFATGEGWDVI